MISEESQRMRGYMSRAAIPESLDELIASRKAWEDGMLQEPLPSEISALTIVAGGVDSLELHTASSDPSARILFVHGGGFNAGSALTHRQFGAQLAMQTGIPVLLPNYRLAPEATFPAALDDLLAVWSWLLDQGIAPERMVVGGDSAGGQLAITLCLAARDRGLPLPAALLLISPVTDLTLSGQSVKKFADDDVMVDPVQAAWTGRLYAGDYDFRDPLLSPLFADLHGLPPCQIHVGSDEVLLDDSLGFAKAAKQAKVKVDLHEWKGMWHGFPIIASLPESQQAIGMMTKFVAEQMK